MEYEITKERDAYLRARGYTILSACPGSGKTTSIVKKLHSIADYCVEHYGKHTGFACLSFTNKACAELRTIYCEMHGESLCYPNLVATIDSFIMQSVVTPFWYLCPLCGKKPLVVNEKDILEKVYYNKVFQNGEWREFLPKELSPFNVIIHQKSPAKISFEKDGIIKWDNHEITNPEEIEYANAVFRYRLNKGYINSSDALWIACYILQNHPEVSDIIINRYPYVIVDEAQDNSELHFFFFQLLREAGLCNLEFIGDICQSIYGFRNARPELLQRKMEDGEWEVLSFTECRRSNQRIIDLYSILKTAGLPEIRAYHVTDLNIPIIVYKYNEGNIRDIITDFHRECDEHGLEKRIVLARGTNKCKQLAGIKDLNFRYWKTEIPYLLIDAVYAFEDNEMALAFSKIRQMLGLLKYGDNHEERRVFIHKIEQDVEINKMIFGFILQIPPFSLSFTDWTSQATELIQRYWGLDVLPVFEAYQKKTDSQGRNMRTIAGLSVEEYYQSNSNHGEYGKCVNTIHAVKGATMDAVLLFLSENSKGESISLKDFLAQPVPHMSEGQRLIYVACSRAKQFLALAVPDTVSNEEIRSSLSGKNVEIR